MSNLFEKGSGQPGGYRDVPPSVADGSLEGIRVIDVREPHEYSGELGHIAGAELVPLGTVPQQVQSWNKDLPLLIVCRSGNRSSRAAAFLVQQGFRQVMNLAGGMLAWNAQQLPVERT